MSRVLLKLRKGEAVKYVSHLELVRAFGFALRRAEIPVAYSAGFNPRPRMQFGRAVGVGVTSDDERIVLDLTSDMNPAEIRDRLNAKLPSGLEALSVEAVPEGVKSPLSAINAARFRIAVSWSEGCDSEAVRQAIDGMLESGELKVMRVRDTGSKEVDIRPYLLGVDSLAIENGDAVIEVTLGFDDSGGARPQDFVQALGSLVANLRVRGIHRIEQFRQERKAGE
jgi:radical SAM-linked protein